MDTRKRIQNRIMKKELEIQELESSIREGKAYLQALQDTLKMFPRSIASPEATFRPGSLVHKTYELLKQNGKPIHINEIMKSIGIEPSKRASLASSLNVYIKKDEIFTRPSPGTYGLHEFENTNSNNEPPSNFGSSENEEITELDPF